ncbi:ER membrane protein complex subunit [Canna indica]|uniref:ER membrane protein complex subunit n=1 Tax=Canna indica TaxID=4628 RepID=A0AAQ3Q6Z0_9LILI|nr:ER membrane protein complex subunit [Canna indica]
MPFPVLLLLFFSGLISSSIAAPFSSGDGYIITGRVKMDGVASTGFGVSEKHSNAKIILNGGQRVTFVRADGYFTFHNVPAGTHLIEVVELGYLFSPVRVDISARFPGKIQAALMENRKILDELILEPLRVEQYYEIRRPFSIMSLVKSPMGMMMGAMLIVMFVMPKLVENMDPEEIKKAQEEMRANFLPRSS